MRIDVHIEGNEMDTPIEFANAIIKNKLEKVNDYELAEYRKRELAEIAEHIQVFLKYSREEVM